MPNIIRNIASNKEMPLQAATHLHCAHNEKHNFFSNLEPDLQFTGPKMPKMMKKEPAIRRCLYRHLPYYTWS